MIKVNGKEVPQDAVDFELHRLIEFYAAHGMQQEEVRKQMPVLKDRAIQQAIGARLLFDQAEMLDIVVTEQEIDERLEDMKKHAHGEEKFNQLLKDKGLNIVEFRNQIKLGRRVDKLVEQVTRDTAEPTDADAEAYFEQHKSEFSKGESVRCQHILISTQGKSDEEKLVALMNLRDIRKRVSEGADFASEAAAHSDCPSGKQAGGSLGWFGRGMMVKEFEDAAFSMPVGGVSDIIETQFGYHIIYKNDEEPASTPEFHEVVDRIRDYLRHNAKGEALTAYVEELRSKAQIEIS